MPQFNYKYGLPIIQAHMAGVSTPQLAASVSNSGAIGSLGLAGQSPANVRKSILETRDLTSNPFNVNFFQYEQPECDTQANKRWIQVLWPLFQISGITPPHDLKPVYSPVDQEIIDILLDLRPSIVSFHFGYIQSDWALQLQSAGITLWATATSVKEAKKLNAAGCQGVILQGIEAGGHRGTWDGCLHDGKASTLDLVKRVRKALGPKPILIAAGGIMDGGDIRTALDAGANMAQLGTAFISCPQSAVNEDYRLRLESDDPTILHNVVSGRYARGFHNRYVDYCLGFKPAPFPYDAQKQLAKYPEYVNQWAGQEHSRCRRMDAKELVRVLADEAGLTASHT